MPNFSIPSRRQGSSMADVSDRPAPRPPNPLVDSAGTRLIGDGEWLARKHGSRHKGDRRRASVPAPVCHSGARKQPIGKPYRGLDLAALNGIGLLRKASPGQHGIRQPFLRKQPLPRQPGGLPERGRCASPRHEANDRPSAPSAFRIDGVLSFRHQVGMIGSTPLRLGGKRERGGVRQHRIRGCPRNCKRRVRLTMPLERSGKASQGGEPRARRPAGHASNHNVFGCEDKEVGP